MNDQEANEGIKAFKKIWNKKKDQIQIELSISVAVRQCGYGVRYALLTYVYEKYCVVFECLRINNINQYLLMKTTAS